VQDHDKSFTRWMPHIVLLWGFIEEDHFANAAEIFKDALASFSPFTLSLKYASCARAHTQHHTHTHTHN
jgi:hypothetical protein